MKQEQPRSWSVVDPAGIRHTKSSRSKEYSHAIIRRNKGAESYFVSWSTSEQRARAESKVQIASRDYVEVVTLEQSTTSKEHTA